MQLYYHSPAMTTADDDFELTPRVYAELRALAGRYFRGRGAHTLQPTALVNEVYLKLDRASTSAHDREHFFAIAARAMRQILTDHARRAHADKRGGDLQRVTLDGQVALDEATPRAIDLLELDAVLTRLAEASERQARIVELRFFAGLSVPEVALALDCSARTVEREWRFARAWLRRALER